MKKGKGSIIGEDFRRMQLLELDMLIEFDRVCRENNIKYSIISGTLLGAVRHKGFIPWDDDADIAMLREEYEKFKSVTNKINKDICFFQDHDTEKEYIWGYGKLRRTGTTYIRPGQEKQNFKTGVYIDILPLDDIPCTTPGQIMNDFYCFLLRKVLWASIGKYDNNINLFERFVYKCLSRIDVEWVFHRIRTMADRSGNLKPNPVRVLMLPAGGKEISLYSKDKNKIGLRYGMPKDWMLNLTEIEFEGYSFMGIKEYDL